MKEINKGIIAKKIGMTKVIGEKGVVTPVTVLEAFENIVIAKKNIDKDGYKAVKIAFKELKLEKLNKPNQGQFKNVEKFFKKITELRLKDSSQINVGDAVKVDMFTENEKVNASGICKGSGFTGTVKRYNFKISPMSHGSKSHRRQGSISAGTDPGKVWKGMKMPGQYGNSKITVKNLKIVKVIAEKNLLLVKGSVPGAVGGIIKVYN